MIQENWALVCALKSSRSIGVKKNFLGIFGITTTKSPFIGRKENVLLLLKFDTHIAHLEYINCSSVLY